MTSISNVTDEKLLPGKWWYISIIGLTIFDVLLMLRYSLFGVILLIFPIYIFLLGVGIQEDERSEMRHAS